MDFSSLSKVSDGYTAGQIHTVVKTVLTEKRIARLSRKPLKALEFVTPLAKIDPVFTEEEEAFKQWYTRTPLGRKRELAAQREAEEAAGGGNTKNKKGAPGKKKK
ncbi:unnamed protein product [Protopolystoma xenopodis]|uniref:Uncharacterized protein n=1 Tax=Protopolystoma xenopodis TaxID=117903 RepID=A0A448XBI0_9PLAT|nr:unnamed protein product [Protopolystoma xenopodis]